MLYADDIRDMISMASGVSEGDISSAAAKKSISLYDAFALSIRNTEKLRITGENVVQSESQHLQAIGSYLPTISLNAARPIPDNNPPSGATGPLPSKAYVYLYARQPIITGFNEWTSILQTKKVTSVLQHTLVLSVQQQLLTVAQKYYLVCQLQDMLVNNQEIVNLYKKMKDELAHRVAVGKNRQNDLLRTDAQISRLEAQVESISSQLETARSDLAATIGVSGPVAVSGGINLSAPVFRADDLHSVASRRREVIIAKENIDVADTNLSAAWGGHLPMVYLEGNYRLYTEGNVQGDKLYAAVVASMPIFEGGITSEKITQAQSAKRQAELVLAQTTRAVEEDIDTSYNTWNSFIKQSDAYKTALASAERNYVITMNDYRLNLVTILDVITVLTDLQQSRNDYKTALLAAELSRIKLGVATNEFPGSGNSVLKNAP